MFANLTAMLALSATLAAPVPKEKKVEHYHPTEVGTTWGYRFVRDPNPNARVRLSEDIWTTTITKVETKGDEITITEKRDDQQGPENEQRYLLTPKGMFSVGSTAQPTDTPKMLLQYPIAKKATWGWDYKLDDKPWKNTHTVVDVEEVKVEAGTFKAVKIEIVKQNLDTKQTNPLGTGWYAVGVGCVKWVVVTDEGDTFTMEMTSFTLPKK
jgi:hypothetical protein